MSKLWFRVFLISVLAVAVAGFAWGQSTIKVMSSSGTSYLATSQGMTLYYFTKDASGKSSCTGGCAKFWPPFSAANLSVSGNVPSADFGSIVRPSGAMQATYDGWPLYTFAGDSTPGQMKGQGFKGLWYVATVPFYTVAKADSANGPYLVSGSGKTLYYFTKDSADKSVCMGGCARLWPPFDVSNIVVPSGLNASNFSTITRPDGSQQVTYKGYPLYYFSGDSQRGETKGEGFRQVWYTIDPAKFDPPSAVKSTSTAVASSGSSGSSW